MIDRKNFLLNVIKSKGLLKLTPEIRKLIQFALPMLKAEKQDLVVQYMICLDFLVKGVLIHWQLKLNESPRKKASDKNDVMTSPQDANFPILLGDQYHSMDYYMVARMGNVELTKALTKIEEGFWKIFFNIEKFGADIKENLKFLYEHFYNYMPQFIGNYYKGLGVIYELNTQEIELMFQAGV